MQDVLLLDVDFLVGGGTAAGIAKYPGVQVSYLHTVLMVQVVADDFLRVHLLWALWSELRSRLVHQFWGHASLTSSSLLLVAPRLYCWHTSQHPLPLRRRH